MAGSKSLAELIRAHRADASLTIETLAQRSKISDRTISDIERGVSVAPQQRTLQALADALELDTESAKALYRAARGRQRQAVPPDRVTAIAPALLPDFTGREEEVDAIVDYLAPEHNESDGPRIVVICGSPGIGKTTAAVEALRRASGGRPRGLFVDLAGLDSLPMTPLQILQSLLRQAADESTSLPRSVDAAAKLWRQQSEKQPTLILLDNAANEEQLRPVLASSVACAVIVTSRRSLSGLEGAFRVTLQPLGEDASKQLLGRIIPASQRTDAELTELAELCGDVPLALRIAGNRVASQPTWTTADFIARMRHEERRLRTLTAGDLGVGAAFASSYDNLESNLSDLYRSLPLIEGSTFDARIASSIIPDDVLDTEDMLDELTDLGLLEARGSTRYRLHDLARLFAADRLRLELSADVTHQRRENLRLWLMASANRAGLWFEPEGPARTLSDRNGLGFLDADSARIWLESEADSWFAAYRQSAALADHESVLLVADSLHWFSDLWLSWGHWHDLFSLSAAAAVALNDPTAEATHLGYLAWADITELGDYSLAERDAIRARDAADRSGDDSQRGWSRFYLGWAHDLLGDAEQTIVDAQDSLRYFGAANDRAGILQSTSLLAAAYHSLSGPDRAIEAHRELLDDLQKDAGSIPANVALFTRSSAEHLLAEEYLSAGRTTEAIRWARSSLEAAKQIDYPLGVVFNLLTLAQAEARIGRIDESWANLREAEQLAAANTLRAADAHIEVARTFIRDLDG